MIRALHVSLAIGGALAVLAGGTTPALGARSPASHQNPAGSRTADSPTASASRRRPTRSEAAAIRSAALRSLHGRGWAVSAIRVSTIRAAHRYASAAVDNRITGVGGEMILRRDGERWRRIFFGTNDFCEANAPRRVLRDLGFRC